MQFVLWMLLMIFWGAYFPAARAEESSGILVLGVQGGPTYSTFAVHSPLTQQVSNTNGFVAGAYLELGLPVLTLRPELNYVTKGYQLDGVATVRNHYLEVPVLVKMNPLGRFLVSPFILFGLSYSHYLSSDVTVLGATATYRSSSDHWDLAAVAAAGAELNLLEHLVLSAQARYNLGLRSVDDSINVKTRAWYLLGGIGLPF